MNARSEGFTIVEVVVAMVLMAVIIMMLGGLTYTSAQQAVVTADATARQAASLELVNRFHTLPFDQLAANAGCDVVGTTNAQFRRCVTVVPGDVRTTVQIVTTPQQRTAEPVTVTFVRSGPPTTNVLCTTGC